MSGVARIFQCNGEGWFMGFGQGASVLILSLVSALLLSACAAGELEDGGRGWSEEEGGTSSFQAPASAQAYATPFPLATRTAGQQDPLPDFIGGKVFRSLAELDRRGLRSGEVKELSWSGDYWPYQRGALGYRYADPGFPNSLMWRRMSSYITANPAPGLVAQGGAKVATLSPSEKYDLLVGDSAYSLTDAMWLLGKDNLDDNGQVPEWMGLCQGWAAASVLIPRPKYPVTLPAAKGKTPVTFYPDDIKALVTLLWGKAPGERRVIGTRCNEEKPKRSPEGRVLSEACFDVTPEDWHRAVVTRVGAQKKSLIMDIGYDVEVWNHPVISYSYKYVHPTTGVETESLKEALQSLADVRDDRYRAWRDSRSRWLVGIVMDVVYGSDNEATVRQYDSEKYDRTEKLRLTYDLELDAKGLIVKGEWHVRNHPDLIWIPERESAAESVADEEIRELEREGVRWSGERPLPKEWQMAALKASQNGQPLGKVIEELLRRSQKPPQK